MQKGLPSQKDAAFSHLSGINYRDKHFWGAAVTCPDILETNPGVFAQAKPSLSLTDLPKQGQ